MLEAIGRTVGATATAASTDGVTGGGGAMAGPDEAVAGPGVAAMAGALATLDPEAVSNA